MAWLVQTDNRKKQTDKQIGCMSGFLQIFDRQQILAGKRIHSSKRLPPSTVTGVGESKETTSAVDSREISQELKKPDPHKQVAVVLSASPDSCQSSPVENINHRRNSPVVKPYNEMARFSIDSERSPSVIARLMGLESLTSSEQKSAKFVAKPKLMRSNSESRVSRDLIRSKYIDRNNFQVKVPSLLHKQESIVNAKLESSRSLFDSTYFSPERKKKVLSMQGDFEKSKMNGLEEPNSDLTTLRQILEVLQLKGLLHSSKNRESLRTFVFDRNSPSDGHRFGHDYRVRRSSPARIESNLKSCNSIVKRKPLSIEIRRRANESFERNSQTSSPSSPKLTPKRTGSVRHSVTNRSPRNYKQTESVSVNSRKQKFIKNIVREDESSSISESTFSTPSTADSEKSKWDGCKDGRSLLQRCDKLLHSIAEMNMNMNNATESPPSSTTVLPSPVSVLDSGFDKDELSSPSTSIDFKATSVDNFEDDTSVHSVSPTNSTQHEEECTSNDPEFIYISKILQASQQLNLDSNIFYSLENKLYNTENTSNVSKRERKLIFDVIIEFLDKNRDLPPWKALNEDSGTLVKHIWNEFQKIREINSSHDDGILDLISVVLKKDLVAMNGWGDHPIEMSEAVLDVERMIFKDLVSEVIEDLVGFSGNCVFLRAQRRLVF